MATEQLQQSAERAREMFLAPTQELTSLNIDFLGKLADIHLNSIKNLTDLGLQNARAALEVRDAEGFQQYIQRQSETASTLTSQVQEESRKLVDLGQDYARKAGEVAQSRLGKTGKAA